MIKMTERRTRNRLHPRDLTFIAMRPTFEKLGKLLDINEDGLCFQYMAQIAVQRDHAEKEAPVEIDMFMGNKEYYLPRMPCAMVYDKQLEESMTFQIGLEYRRCGLKFKEFTKAQGDKLDFYLKKHTATGTDKLL